MVDGSSQRVAMKNLKRTPTSVFTRCPGGVVVDSSSQSAAMKNLKRTPTSVFTRCPGGEIGRRNGLKIRR